MTIKIKMIMNERVGRMMTMEITMSYERDGILEPS